MVVFWVLVPTAKGIEHILSHSPYPNPLAKLRNAEAHCVLHLVVNDIADRFKATKHGAEIGPSFAAQKSVNLLHEELTRTHAADRLHEVGNAVARISVELALASVRKRRTWRATDNHVGVDQPVHFVRNAGAARFDTWEIRGVSARSPCVTVDRENGLPVHHARLIPPGRPAWSRKTIGPARSHHSHPRRRLSWRCIP